MDSLKKLCFAFILGLVIGLGAATLLSFANLHIKYGDAEVTMSPLTKQEIQKLNETSDFIQKLEAEKNQFQNSAQNLAEELKERDETIQQLQSKLDKTEQEFEAMKRVSNETIMEQKAQLTKLQNESANTNETLLQTQLAYEKEYRAKIEKQFEIEKNELNQTILSQSAKIAELQSAKPHNVITQEDINTLLDATGSCQILMALTQKNSHVNESVKRESAQHFEKLINNLENLADKLRKMQ